MQRRITSFQTKPRKPMARTAFTRKSPSQTLKKAPRKRVVSKSGKVPMRGYKTPSWFNSIKLGSHGQTPAQKRYWKFISDLYRKEDFEKYGGKCVSCHMRLENWQDGQLAHYKAWANCHAWFKYERKNLAFSCGRCNQINDGFVAERFKEALIQRHGPEVISWIETENEKYRGKKMENWEIVERVENLVKTTHYKHLLESL